MKGQSVGEIICDKSDTEESFEDDSSMRNNHYVLATNNRIQIQLEELLDMLKDIFAASIKSNELEDIIIVFRMMTQRLEKIEFDENYPDLQGDVFMAKIGEAKSLVSILDGAEFTFNDEMASGLQTIFNYLEFVIVNGIDSEDQESFEEQCRLLLGATYDDGSYGSTASIRALECMVEELSKLLKMK